MVIAAVGQICSTTDKAHNLTQCRTLVRKAVAANAKVLFLPEASDYLAPSSEEALAMVQPVEKNEFVLGLQKEARQARIAINVGIHEPAEDGKRMKNTTLWIDEDGEIAHRYQKLHLFDVEIADGPNIKESENVEKGREILPPFPTAIGSVGLAICFDLRFPEISLSLARQGAEVIAFPSAFTVPTGKAHWELLLRARAIETQAYICASAQAGYHNDKRVSYGHSMIIGPWGEKLAELGGESESSEPEIATAEIDLDMLRKVRKEMPLLRRTDVYPEL